jgi:cytochrome c oxidase cbb3-type subunit III
VLTRTYLVFFGCLTLLAGTLRAQSAGGGEGALLFRHNCSSCHGSDGRGGERAPNIATQHDVVSATDAQLKDAIGNGIPEAGMPSFDYLGNEKVNKLVAYLRVLQGVGDTARAPLPGDPAAGQAIFFGKASCSNCHMVHGRGGFLGEDLSDYAKGRTVDAIRKTIVNPASSPGGGGQLTSIVMSDGTKYAGVVRAENNFTTVLQSEDGTYHSIARDRMAKTDSSTLMPQDFGQKITQKELDDVVSFLIKSATPVQPVSVGRDQQ